MAVPPNASPNASRIDRRFDVLRSKVEQDAGAAQQQAQEGLARKAVAGGNQNSGAFLKLQGRQTEDLNKQKQNALSDVESQREGAQAQADEIQAQRDFAKSEREAGQGFAAQQAENERWFQGKEAQKNRTFQSSESALQRGFSEKLFNKEMNFKKQVQKDANSQFAKQFKMASQQFDFDKEVSRFNMDMANKQFNKKDLMENMESIAPFSVSKIADGGGGGVGKTVRSLGG